MSLFKLETMKRQTAKRKQSRGLNRSLIEQHLQVLDKQNNLVPFRYNRPQAHLYPRLTGRDLILKARQLGFSTMIRGMHETKAMTQRCRLATLAHDQDTTDLLRRMSKRFWETLPDDIRPARGIDNASTTIYDNTKSEVVIRTAGSRAGGRGSTLSDVHGSEVAFWKDANDNMASIMQAVPLEGSIILESTPNGAQGWFYEEAMKALAGDSIWTLHFYEWWWDDDYLLPLAHGESLSYNDEEQKLIDKHDLTPEQIKWRRYKLKEIPHEFKQEYPEDIHECFLTSGNSYFGNVEHVFTAPQGKTYDETHRYVAGLDFGQSNDFTVMVVIDTYDNSVVEMLRINRLDWHTMRKRIKLLSKKWHCSILAEWNSIGNPNIEELRRDKIHVIPFMTTAQSKPPLIQSLYAGLHEQGLTVLDDSNMKHELRNFISTQSPSGAWKFEASSGSHDDCVIALALAWFLAVRGNVEIIAI